MNDLRFGLRMLRKNPEFTTVAVLTLALGIGANTGMFTLVHAFLLRPLPVPQSERLVQLYASDRTAPNSYRLFSYFDYSTIRGHNTIFASLLAHQMTMLGWTEGDTTHRVFGEMISANYFSALGVTLAHGREFLLEEDTQPVPVAIVSDNFWKQHGNDAEPVGKTVRLNGTVFNIVGITRKEFTGTMAMVSPDFWVPLGMYDRVRNGLVADSGKSLQDHANHSLVLMGRLRPGLTKVAAQSELKVLANQLAEAFPAEDKNVQLSVHAPPRFIGGAEPQSDATLKVLAITLMGLSAIVLLIACSNLAHLLLARSATRQKEMAVRMALGAGRWRPVRQLLTEGLLLALAGGAAGTLLAWWATAWLASTLAPLLPLTLDFQGGPDLLALGTTLALSVMSTLLFALVPALKLARIDLLTQLRLQSAEFSSRPRWWRRLGFADASVGTELALSLALLTAAGLFVRGALNACAANPGFVVERGLLLEVDTSLAGYDDTRGRAVFRQLTDKLRVMPGVESVSPAVTVPFGATHLARHILPVGQAGANRKPIFAHFNGVGADYFKTLGLPLLQGRAFTRAEEESAALPHVLIIDDLIAQQLWPRQSALGQQVRFVDTDGASGAANVGQAASAVFEVVGIVPWSPDNLSGEPPKPHLYAPFGSAYQASANLHIRIAQGGPIEAATMLKEVRATARAVDEQLPIVSLKTLRDYFDTSPALWMFRIGAILFVSLGALAMFLAVGGLYGVMAYLVARRTRELGIRMALGAQRADVFRLVLGRGFRVILAGLGLGLFFAYAVGQGLQNLLFEVSASDPVIFITAPMVLFSAGLLACYLPARRATRADPMAALRYE
jgi:predicted permease